MLTVEYTGKPIQCTLSVKEVRSGQEDSSTPGEPSVTPALILTHGAGGTLSSEAIRNFRDGFSLSSPLLCFQGNMNLNSRVKMFRAVCKDQGFSSCLGGRSMGARAAVIAATEETTHLVLISYPLHTNKEVRDDILLQISPSTKVLFMSGDNDNMCDLGRLDEVRKRMKCMSWKVEVSGADHGMIVKPKRGTDAVGKITGEIAADWLRKCDNKLTICRVNWNDESERAECTDWHSEEPINSSVTKHFEPQPRPAPKNESTIHTPTKRGRIIQDIDAISSRTRKCSKRQS